MIASCGEAVLDLLAGRQSRLGGSPFNVALGLARLGAESAFFGALPIGPSGEPFLAALAEAGASSEFVQLVAAPVLRAAVEFVDGQPQYRFSPEHSADRLLRPPPSEFFTAVTTLHVGSLVLGRPPTDGLIETLCEEFPGVLCLDPNVRPGVLGDVKRWRERLWRIAGRADLVKLSIEDAATLAPRRSVEALVEEVLGAGSTVVVVTDGARGARAFSRHGQLAVGAIGALDGDSVGAGDSFMAGLLAGLQAGGSLERARLRALGADELSEPLSFAAAAAGASCRHVGAYAPSRDEVNALLRQHQ